MGNNPNSVKFEHRKRVKSDPRAPPPSIVSRTFHVGRSHRLPPKNSLHQMDLPSPLILSERFFDGFDKVGVGEVLLGLGVDLSKGRGYSVFFTSPTNLPVLPFSSAFFTASHWILRSWRKSSSLISEANDLTAK